MIDESCVWPNRHRLLARSWWTARAQMADLVLEMTHGLRSLAELQGSVAIALELDLVSLSGGFLLEPSMDGCRTRRSPSP